MNQEYSELREKENVTATNAARTNSIDWYEGPIVIEPEKNRMATQIREAYHGWL
jgi:hypothetical protein